MLPTPEPRDGIAFRWIRTATLGNADLTNVSSKFREGWTPSPRADHPELEVLSDLDSRFKDNIEAGGLLLCQTAVENVNARRDYQIEKTRQQIEAVDNTYLKESDPRMPVLPAERRTTFGD
jgi:hypothetical protein